MSSWPGVVRSTRCGLAVLCVFLLNDENIYRFAMADNVEDDWGACSLSLQRRRKGGEQAWERGRGEGRKDMEGKTGPYEESLARDARKVPPAAAVPCSGHAQSGGGGGSGGRREAAGSPRGSGASQQQLQQVRGRPCAFLRALRLLPASLWCRFTPHSAWLPPALHFRACATCILCNSAHSPAPPP